MILTKYMNVYYTAYIDHEQRDGTIIIHYKYVHII